MNLKKCALYGTCSYDCTGDRKENVFVVQPYEEITLGYEDNELLMLQTYFAKLFAQVSEGAVLTIASYLKDVQWTMAPCPTANPKGS